MRRCERDAIHTSGRPRYTKNMMLATRSMRTPLRMVCPTPLLLILIIVLLQSFTYAADFDTILTHDHNHERIGDGASDVDWGAVHRHSEEAAQYNGNHDHQQQELMYEPEFRSGGMGRELLGRQTIEVVTLKNNEPVTQNLAPGQTINYVFQESEGKSNAGKTRTDLPTKLPGSFGAIMKRALHTDTRGADEDGHSKAGDSNSTDPSVLEKRQETKTRKVYISANTCIQPDTNGTQTNATEESTQLTLYVSSTNEKPGPGQPEQRTVRFVEGFANITINATSNAYVAISAPNVTTSGQWSYSLAVSAENYFFHANPAVPAAFLVDTDAKSALIVTNNLTDQAALDRDPDLRNKWQSSTPPFGLFVAKANDTKLKGLTNSFCGLSKLDPNVAKVNKTITVRNLSRNPKQQFHVEGLESGTDYWAVLSFIAQNSSGQGSNVIGGGGQVWQPFKFTTKTDDNCKLVYDMPFCNDVAYAVPTNSSASLVDLIDFYDTNAQNLYKNFSYSLQQIPCNTTNSAQYSLVRSCDDCARDYKNWLCAVTIPRCADFSLVDGATRGMDFLRPRNIAQNYINGSAPDLAAAQVNETFTKLPWYNSSRFGLIDEVIKPGPYREVMPCIDLCYEMVKSCPASFGFACPEEGRFLDLAYGTLDDPRGNGVSLTCNNVGADQPTKSGGVRERTLGWALALTVGLVHFFVIML